MKVSAQCSRVIKKKKQIECEELLRKEKRGERENIISCCINMGLPHLEYCGQFWPTHLHSVQQV